MTDPAPRRRRAVRAAVAVLALVAAAAGLAWEFLPDIVERIAIARLAEMGVPEPRFTVVDVGLDRAELSGISIGVAGEMTARQVVIDYALDGLLEGRLAGVTVRGATLKGSVGPDGVSFGGLDPLLAGGDGGNAVPIPPIRLEDARLDLATPIGPVALDGDGTLSAGDGTLRARLELHASAPQGSARAMVEVEMTGGTVTAVADLGDGTALLPGVLHAALDGEVSLRAAAGRLESLTADLALTRVEFPVDPVAALGAFDGRLELAGGADGWRAALGLADAADSLIAELRLDTPDLEPDSAATVALRLRAAAAAPLWPALGLAAPDSGDATVALVTEIAPGALLVVVDGAAPPSLSGTIGLEVADAAFPGLVDALTVVGALDVALDGNALRIDAPAPILAEVAPAPALLRRLGMPAGVLPSLGDGAAVSLTLDRPAWLTAETGRTTLAGGLTAVIESPDGRRLLDASAAGTVFISGSGVAAYDLPTMELELTLPSESVVPDGHLALSGAAAGSRAADGLHHHADLALAAGAPYASVAGFDLRHVAADLPLAASFAGGMLRIGLRGDGMVAAARVAGPTPISLDGPLRVPFPGRAEPVLTIDLTPAQGPRAALDLTTGPLRLAGTIGTADGPLPVSARLPRLRLTGSTADGGWTGRLQAQGGSVSLPAYDVTASSVGLSVDLAADAPPRVALAGTLTHGGEPAYVVPLTASISAHEVKNGWAFTGTARDANDRISLAISGRHDLSRHVGSATIKLEPIELVPNVREPADYAPWLASLAEDVSGTVALSGDVAWTSETVTSTLELLLRDLSATTRAASFERMNGVIAVDGLAPFTTPAGQTVAVALVDAGLPLTDGLLTFRVAPGPRLEIASGTLHLAGGTVEVEPLTVDPAADNGRGVLLVEDVELGALLSLAGVSGLTGSGRLSGRIPVAVEAGNVVIAGGVLDAEEPGFLSYAPLAPPAALQGQGEAVSLALSALTNFQYQALRLTVDRQAGGAMTVTMHVSGSNPDFYDGYPVEFNLNVSGALDRVLRDSLAGYRIPQIIQERLDEFVD